MKTQTEQIAEAAANAYNISWVEFLFIQLFGRKAVFLQGERRFKARRLGDKIYLMDKRLIKTKGDPHESMQ